MIRNNIVLEDPAELINEDGGVEAFSRAMSTLMNPAMKIGRSDILGAEPYERSDDHGELTTRKAIFGSLPGSVANSIFDKMPGPMFRKINVP